MWFQKKQDAYDNIGSGEEVFISRDHVKGKAFKEFSAMSWEQLEDHVGTDNHLYEIIRRDTPRYSYFDLDGNYQKVQHFIDAFKCGETAREKIIYQMGAAIEDFKADNDIDEVTDLVVLDSSTNAKYSFHIIDRSIAFANQNDCKLYHDRLISHLQETGEFGLLTCVDKCVYDSDRSFRCVNQTKYKDGAQPLALVSDHTIEQTFVTKNVDNGVVYSIPKKWLKAASRKKTFTPPVKEHIEEHEQDEIELLISKLSVSRFDDYDQWIKTVWCLFACGLSPEAIHLESEMKLPSRYDYQSTDSQIQQYDHGKSKFSINTLRAWAYEDSGFEIERQIEAKAAKQPELRKDHFQFLDLLNKYDNKTFVDMLGFDEFISDISKCVSQIIGTETKFSMYTNDDNQFDLTKHLPTLTFWLAFTDEKTGAQSKAQEYDLQKYMNKNKLSFPRYNKIVFKPNDYDLRRHEFNTWPGFKAQRVSDVDMGIVGLFINHIRDVWAGGNEDYYRYLMSWIAQIVKTPHKKTEVAILLQGGQGTGKTMPCDILLERVFGRNVSLMTGGLDSLTQQFNGAARGKIFINCNELSIIDSSSFNSAFDKMKSMVTDRLIDVQMKGLENVQLDNRANFIMTTNNDVFSVIKLDKDDRRYAVFRVNDCHKQDTKYFAKFMNTLDNDEAGDHLYTYFLNYPEDQMVDLRDIPDTDLKREMISNQRSSLERFVAEMDEELDHAVLYDWIGKEGEKAISSGNFYQQYKCWCALHGERTTWSDNTVGGHLKTKKMYKYDGKSRRNGRQSRYYVF